MADKTKNWSICISHNLFLTREQRYALGRDREPQTIVGVNLLVWLEDETGRTSEPAEETFCTYELTNSSELANISKTKHGYKINIPQIGYTPIKPNKEDWDKLNSKQKEKWYTDNVVPISGKNLLDLKDSGGEYLKFIEYYQLDSFSQVIHIIEIKDISLLENSLI